MVAVWQVFNDMQPIAALTLATMSYHVYHHPFPQHLSSQLGCYFRDTIHDGVAVRANIHQLQGDFGLMSCSQTM